MKEDRGSRKKICMAALLPVAAVYDRRSFSLSAVIDRRYRRPFDVAGKRADRR